MGEWKLELAAESLRRGDPTSWDLFMAALEADLHEALLRLVAAPTPDATALAQGEVRGLRRVIVRLTEAKKTVERLQKKGG